MLSLVTHAQGLLARTLTTVDAIGAALAGAEKVNTWRAWLSSTERSTLLTLGALIVLAALLGLWREGASEASS